jgi:hypothetical protein
MSAWALTVIITIDGDSKNHHLTYKSHNRLSRFRMTKDAVTGRKKICVI